MDLWLIFRAVYLPGVNLDVDYNYDSYRCGFSMKGLVLVCVTLAKTPGSWLKRHRICQIHVLPFKLRQPECVVSQGYENVSTQQCVLFRIVFMLVSCFMFHGHVAYRTIRDNTLVRLQSGLFTSDLESIIIMYVFSIWRKKCQING